MYICICNAITDRQIKQAVKDSAAQSVSDMYRSMSCRPQCGRCTPTVLGLMRQPTEQPMLLPQAVNAPQTGTACAPCGCHAPTDAGHSLPESFCVAAE